MAGCPTAGHLHRRTIELEGERHRTHVALATLDRTAREFFTDPNRVYFVLHRPVITRRIRPLVSHVTCTEMPRGR